MEASIQTKRLAIANVLSQIRDSNVAWLWQFFLCLHKIKEAREQILYQLGKFGDHDRQYLTPRMVKVHRTVGNANEVGSIIQYDLPFRFLSFGIVLERVLEDRYLVYRIRDGFAKGGVLIFDISEIRKGVFLLSTYVGFSFPKPRNPLKRLAWWVFKLAFPGFVHDVVWNHALCKLKDLVETRGGNPAKSDQ